MTRSIASSLRHSSLREVDESRCTWKGAAMRVLLLLCLVATACAHSRTPEGALDPRLTTFSYPYPVRTAVVATQRQRLEMAYIDAQPTGAAKGTVVLLHGKNFSAG